MRALLLALVLLAPAAEAQERQVVWWPLVTDGIEIRRVAYPAEAGDIVVMADTTVVIEAREARVGWWPITREYLSDVSRSSPVVAGTVEIEDAAGRTVTVAPEPWLVWHPAGVGAGGSVVVRGAEAAEVHAAYVRDGRAAAEAAQLHQRLVAEHHAAVEAWLKLAAQRPADLPPPPPEFTLPEPEPYHAFASSPETSAVLSLAAGAYRLRLRDAAGGVVAGSERRLVAIAPRAEGVGYVVRPGDRWTQPAVSFRPTDTIYATGQAALYLQPVPVAEFGARQYARLFQPQTVGQADPFLSVWVPRGVDLPEGGRANLVLWQGGARAGEVPVAGFRVAQRTGVARGYDIERFEPAAGTMLKPDFFAMEIARDGMPSAISLTADAELPGSQRRIRRVDPPADALLFLPALIPLLVGGVLRLRRRRGPVRAAVPPHTRAGTA